MNADKTEFCHIEYKPYSDSWICFRCSAEFKEVTKPPPTTFVDLAVPFAGAAIAFFVLIVVPVLHCRVF